MSLLVLPRLGVGNAVAFDNNFSVVKDGNPWVDGGADTFDGTQGVQVSGPQGWVTGWLTVGGDAYSRADGDVLASRALGLGAVDLGVYAGWVAAGIFACEVELGHQPPGPLPLRFACNTGYDNGSPTGWATRAFEIGGQACELKTVWISRGAQDSWRDSGETQITVTIVPFLAAQNAPGSNPVAWSGSGDDREVGLATVQLGATVYIQWGRVDVAAVQDWIVGDLVASEGFSASPHPRIALATTPPTARLAPLARLGSPASDRGAEPGGYGARHAGLGGLRRNIHFGGKGRIAGTVKERSQRPGQPDQADIPLVRRVLLFSEHSQVLVAETWSDASGAYAFEQLDLTQRYCVVSQDHQRLYRAVIADRLRPEPMPSPSTSPSP